MKHIANYHVSRSISSSPLPSPAPTPGTLASSLTSTEHDQPSHSSNISLNSACTSFRHSPRNDMKCCDSQKADYSDKGCVQCGMHGFGFSRKTSVSARRKAFVLSVTMPSPKKGFIVCRLCSATIWGPNGTVQFFQSLRWIDVWHYISWGCPAGNRVWVPKTPSFNPRLIANERY